MALYKTKKEEFSIRRYGEIRNNALIIFNQIKKRTKRKPYIRSAYFNKQKIFFDYFWPHLMQKSLKERTRRLKYFSCAIDLARNSKVIPTSKENVDNRNEILHRFIGQTKEKEIFFVQIKENKKNGRKYFISCFPLK